MPFQKGQSGNPRGRPAGSQNKATGEFKEALTRLLNAADLEELLKDTPPERRVEALCRLAEFAHPRLGKSEVTGRDGEPIAVSIAINGIRRDREDLEPPGDAG